MKQITKLLTSFLLISTFINVKAQNNESEVLSNVLIEEVVVTARKKEESAQDVPIALSALNQEQ